MDEALFARLADRLADGRGVALASVVAARGATPRKPGARMLIEADRIAFSVGGGAMEARVIETARALLAAAGGCKTLEIALTGQPGSAGICGGTMRVAVRVWQGVDDAARAQAIASALAEGEATELSGAGMGDRDAAAQVLHPRPRLLIAGAGHCGHALAQLAGLVDFEVWLADSRPECFPPDRDITATCIDATSGSLRRAANTARDLYIVLLSRDYPTDVAALDALVGSRCAFLGMMGSRRRVAQVRRALPAHAAWLEGMQAPVGLPIGDETPHEIAVGILAQLIARRSARRASG